MTNDKKAAGKIVQQIKLSKGKEFEVTSLKEKAYFVGYKNPRL